MLQHQSCDDWCHSTIQEISVPVVQLGSNLLLLVLVWPMAEHYILWEYTHQPSTR